MPNVLASPWCINGDQYHPDGEDVISMRRRFPLPSHRWDRVVEQRREAKNNTLAAVLQLPFDTTDAITTCKLLLHSIRYRRSIKRSWPAPDNAFVTMHCAHVHAVTISRYIRCLELSLSSFYACVLR